MAGNVTITGSAIIGQTLTGSYTYSYTGAWETVGNPRFSSGKAAFTSLAFDNEGTPYVAYSDSYNSAKATVMKYNSGTNIWEEI